MRLLLCPVVGGPTGHRRLPVRQPRSLASSQEIRSVTRTHLPASLDSANASPGVFWLGLLTAAATFPLIFMGGLVTSHHAGMSVPDWPNSYGYNMFLFPPSQWIGGIFYEHTHRLMGMVVGMLAMALVAWAWRTPYRGLSWVVLAPSSFKAYWADCGWCWSISTWPLFTPASHKPFLPGGLRGRDQFALVASAPNLAGAPGGRGLATLGIVTTVAIFCQLMIGATMRHFDAGLAIPDLPLAYSRWLPPATAQGLAEINHLRAFQLNLDPVTMTQVWLNFAHRMGAVLVTLLALTLAHRAFWRRDGRGLAIAALALVVLLLAQLTLGVLVVLLHKPADITSIHVAIGALVLLTSFVLTARARRLYAR